MNRRNFLSLCGVAAGFEAMRSARKGWSAAVSAMPQYYNPARLYHVGISSWSFHNYFASTRQKHFNLPGPMITLLDFPRIIADRYEVHHLELSASHFTSTDPAYLLALRRELLRAGSHLVNIAVDMPQLVAGGGLSDRDPTVRGKALAVVKQWMDVARDLGARSVRADPGSVNAADLTPTLDSYRQLATYGRLRDIDVLIENHLDTTPEQIDPLIRALRSPRIGALPDFSNFPSAAARIAGLPLLFRHALTLCHAKGISFDAQGAETTFDFPRCVTIAKAYRFRGVYSVEYEGPGDPYQGVQNVLNELMRFL